MSDLVIDHPAAAPAARDRTDAPELRDQADRPDRDRPSRLWTLLESLAYAGAFIDPTGVLAAQRLRFRLELEEEKRREQR